MDFADKEKYSFLVSTEETNGRLVQLSSDSLESQSLMDIVLKKDEKNWIFYHEISGCVFIYDEENAFRISHLLNDFEFEKK